MYMNTPYLILTGRYIESFPMMNIKPSFLMQHPIAEIILSSDPVDISAFKYVHRCLL